LLAIPIEVLRLAYQLSTTQPWHSVILFRLQVAVGGLLCSSSVLVAMAAGGSSIRAMFVPEAWVAIRYFLRFFLFVVD
jgi:hypothetical protein